MRTIVAAAAAVMLATTASAQTVPDVQGVWSGPFRTVIWGENIHHPGQAAGAAAPRVREIGFSLEVEGQDGALIWGRSWSSPDRKEPFAAVVGADGKTIVGADTDGSLTATIAGSDRLELCYTHTGLGPSKSIVASCGTLRRSK
jgi:hypothetical protein